MKLYRIDEFLIDEDGCFLKYGVHEFIHPHDTWKCTGCAEAVAFGRLKSYSLVEFLDMIEHGKIVRFKNGKPRFFITDMDHGTFRIQMKGIRHTTFYERRD